LQVRAALTDARSSRSHRLSPIISPCLAATAFIFFILAWNEFFLAVNLTAVNGATVPIYLVGFIQPEGLSCWPAGPRRTSRCLACPWVR
jgi:sorbitol/mannitol transport system permease protein